MQVMIPGMWEDLAMNRVSRFILFYSIFILFYSILFYSTRFTLFYFILFYSFYSDNSSRYINGLFYYFDSQNVIY